MVPAWYVAVHQRWSAPRTRRDGPYRHVGRQGTQNHGAVGLPARLFASNGLPSTMVAVKFSASIERASGDGLTVR